jgi:hypothetical protein
MSLRSRDRSVIRFTVATTSPSSHPLHPPFSSHTMQHHLPRYNLRQRNATSKGAPEKSTATPSTGSFEYQAVLPPFPFAWLHRRASTHAWPWVHVLRNTGEDPYDAAALDRERQRLAEEEDRSTAIPVPGDELTATQTLVQGVAAAFGQLLYVGKSEAECHLYRTWFPTAKMWTAVTPQTLEELKVATARQPTKQTEPRFLVVSRSVASDWTRLDASVVLAFLKEMTGEHDTLILIETDDIEQLPSEVRQQAPISLMSCGAFVDLAWQWQSDIKSIYAESVPDELFTDSQYRKGWIVAARGKGEPRLFDVALLMSMEERRAYASKVHRWLRPPSTTYTCQRTTVPSSVVSRLASSSTVCFFAMTAFYFCLLTYASQAAAAADASMSL